jgi:uncharacterized protein
MNRKRIWEIGATIALLLALAGVAAGFLYYQRLNAELRKALSHQDGARVKALVERGANPNIRGAGGETVLMLAGDAAFTRELIQRGVDVNARTINGETALLWASPNNQETVNLLLAAGADVSGDRWGNTPLFYAASSGDVALARELLDRGAAVDAPEVRGISPLMVSVRSPEYLPVAKLLLDRGAKVNHRDRYGGTPLMAAAMGADRHPSNAACLRLLLARGARLNSQDLDGNTALMVAARSGTPENVRVLLRAGADPTPKNKAGKTALDFARERRNPRITYLLEEVATEAQRTRRAR